MARSIPVYQRQIIPQGVQGGPSARGTVSPRSPIGEALESVGHEVQRFGLKEVREQRKKLESDSAITTANTLSNGEIAWHEDFKKRTQEWKVGDKPLREKLESDFNTWMSSSAEKLQTDSSKKYFQQHAIQMRTRLLNAAFDYQEKATSDKLTADTIAGEQADENLVFTNPVMFDEVYRRRMETVIARTDLSEASKIKYADEYKRKLSLSVERGEANRDPRGWYEKRFGKYAIPGHPETKADIKQPVTHLDVANAIFGQESEEGRADTSRISAQDVTGPMQVKRQTFDGMKKLGLIPADFDWTNPAQNKEAGFKWVEYLSRKYDNDPAKMAAAYYGGEKAVREDGTIIRGMKNIQRPSDPTVGQYVDQVLSRIKKSKEAGQIDVAAIQPEPILPSPPSTFNSMDYEQQITLKSHAEAFMLRESSRADALAEKQRIEAEKSWKAVTEVLDAGKMLAPEFISQLTTKFRGTAYEGAILSLIQQAPDSMAFSTMPIVDQSAKLLEMQSALNKQGATPEQVKRYERLEKAHKATITEMKENPLKAAVERGVITELPILPANSAEWPENLRQRSVLAESVAKWAGKPVSIFQPHEIDQISKSMSAAPPKDRAVQMQAFAQSMTGPQMREFARQLGSKDETLAAAAILSSKNARTTSGRMVSEIIMTGSDAMKEQRVKFPTGQSPTELRNEIDEMTRGAFLSENARRAASDAAISIYAGLLAEGSTPDVKQVVNLATGGVMEMNGQKFVKPWGYSDAMVMKALRDYDSEKLSVLTKESFQIGNQKIKPADLEKYMPGAQLGPSPKAGFYSVSIGGRLLLDDAGLPVLLPIGAQ